MNIATAAPSTINACEAEISFLRDALDHIARTAHQSRSQTVRVRWIEARANGALEGKPYVRGQFREPRNGPAEFEKMQAEIQRMKASLPGLPEVLSWAVGRWNAQVAHRPLQNVHRRTLDGVWRQVIRHCGGDDVVLCGPRHDELLAEARAAKLYEPDECEDAFNGRAEAAAANAPTLDEAFDQVKGAMLREVRGEGDARAELAADAGAAIRFVEVTTVPADTMDRLQMGRATDGDQMIAHNALAAFSAVLQGDA